MSNESQNSVLQMRIPGSKSMTHRALLLAALSRSECRVRNPLLSEDTLATLSCLEALGAEFRKVGGDMICSVSPGLTRIPAQPLDCGNSGTTLRLMLGQGARLSAATIWTGDDSLRQRPNGALLTALAAGGVTVVSESGKAPIQIEGPLRSGSYDLGARVSSQFASSLLCALTMVEGPSTLRVERPVLSRPYLNMTFEMLRAFGCEIELETADDALKYSLAGASLPSLDEWRVEGDWSTAAFPAVASVLMDKPVEFHNLNPESVQGDRAWVDILADWGSDFEWRKDVLTLYPGLRQGDRRVDLGRCPDLFPALCVLAAVREGTTSFHGAPQLRHKESDRIKAMAEGLCALGIDLVETPDGLIIHGGRPSGGVVDGRGDHRIYMAFSVLGLVTDTPVEVLGARCEAVSYPEFHRDLALFK